MAPMMSPKLRYLLQQFKLVDEEIEAIEEEDLKPLRERKASLAERILKICKTKTVVFTGIRFTPVNGTDITMDDAKLRRAIGAAAWKRITRPVVDQDALAREVAAGRISVTVVAQCSTEIPRKPYLRVTRPK